MSSLSSAGALLVLVQRSLGGRWVSSSSLAVRSPRVVARDPGRPGSSTGAQPPWVGLRRVTTGHPARAERGRLPGSLSRRTVRPVECSPRERHRHVARPIPCRPGHIQSRPTAAARVDGASKFYGTGDAAVAALDDVTVSLARAEFTAIMGPSGSGKSTLLHVLAGLDRPTSGQVYLGDTEITSLNDKTLTLLRRDRIGFIFQSFNLLPTMTAAENIVLPMRIAGRKPDE